MDDALLCTEAGKQLPALHRKRLTITTMNELVDKVHCIVQHKRKRCTTAGANKAFDKQTQRKFYRCSGDAVYQANKQK